MALIIKTWTDDADWEPPENTLVDVQYATTPNQLQLTQGASTFGFVMANSDSVGTVGGLIRINADDGTILGAYSTAPLTTDPNTSGGPNVGSPGHQYVDALGNTWTGNRGTSLTSQGAWCKIGLTVGGTRVSSTGVPDVNGDYLEGPFDYSTAVDRDADALIRTSRGTSDVGTWAETAADPEGTPSGTGGSTGGGGECTVRFAEDEQILLYQRIDTGFHGFRGGTVADGATGALHGSFWGFGYNQDQTLLGGGFNGTTGALSATIPFSTSNAGGYTSKVDATGILWAAGFNDLQSDQTKQLMRYDVEVGGAPTIIGIGTATAAVRGLGIDSLGNVWLSVGGQIKKVTPAGTVTATYNVKGAVTLMGLDIDSSDRLWVADVGATTVWVIDVAADSEGVLLGSCTAGEGVAAGVNGVSIDYAGRPWILCANANRAQRIDPDLTALAVDISVALPTGSAPLCPSGFTGAVNISTKAETGTWTVTHDGGCSMAQWSTMDWTSLETQGATIGVQARAADDSTLLSAETYEDIDNGVDFVLTGRYVQIKVEFTRSTTVQVGPILYDLTISGACPIEGNVTSWFWDGKHGSWWEDEMPAAKAPTSLAVFDGDDPDDRVVAFGSADGFLRVFDRDVDTDDGDPIDSQVLLGPFQLGLPDQETRVSQLQTALARDLGSVDFEWYVSEDPDIEVADLVPVATGTLPAGLSDVNYERARGLYVWLLLKGKGVAWAYESGSVQAAPGGRARTRD